MIKCKLYLYSGQNTLHSKVSWPDRIIFIETLYVDERLVKVLEYCYNKIYNNHFVFAGVLFQIFRFKPFSENIYDPCITFRGVYLG